MEQTDAIAILLAARHQPEIREFPDYQKAQAYLEANPELQVAFETERRYYDQHEDLLTNVRLPDGVRNSMRERVRNAQAAETKIIAWPTFLLPLAAAAAVLVLVGGFITMQLRSGTEAVVRTGTALESLQAFAAELVARGSLDLEKRSDQPQELLAWLRDQGAPVGERVPDSLQNLSTLGCKVYDWKGHQVALVCFRTPDDHVVHLFVADRTSVDLVTTEQQAVPRLVHHREMMSWVDARHAFVLVAHDEGQSLDGLSG